MKSIFASKTFYVNVIALAIAAISNPLGYSIPAEPGVAALAILNVILRFMTHQPVSVTGA